MNRTITGSPARDCLVAVITSDADLHRLREEGWYRIPDRALGRQLSRDALDQASALALYQTSSVRDGLPSAIELWGEIDERRTLARRDLIPDEPYHPSAGALYHLLRLKSVQRLDRPVTSIRPRRITFIRTTRERLFHAADINDLIVGTNAEERLWKTLREREPDVERHYYMRAHGVVMELDFALFRREQGLGIICDERPDAIREGSGVADEGMPEAWRVIRFSPARIDQDLDSCLREITAMADRMSAGGWPPQ